ncbi:MAG: peptide deformylase [Eggerthellaceae bacterium]|nr:peptide deformylase [Eggerthellaceae bacterium]
MIKELVNDEKLLSTPCEPATADDADLAQDLLDTLESIEDAACLAANQIGVTKAVVVYKDDKDRAHVMFNPGMKRALRPYRTEEGCLSREETKKVTRFDQATFTYQELVDGALIPRKKECRGWTAQILQHMIDHCNGKLV